MSGEFAAIDRLAALLGPLRPPAIGIGDDAAVVRGPDGGWLLLAIDTVAASVHADLALTGLDDLGWKAVAANVSDIAAMGGRPAQLMVSVAGPGDTDLDLLYQGIADAATHWHCPVVGGDLTNAGALVVTVAITGWLSGPAILRSGAKPGDGIWVTGSLGLSAAGLRQLKQVGKGATGDAVNAHRRPIPSVEAGLAARAAGATAMIDVSDGLVADLGHLAGASGVGFVLDGIPVGEQATLDEALSGGEDYVLVFTTPADAPVAAPFARLPAPTRIGTCVADAQVRTLAGEALPATVGWEHRWT